MWGTCGAPWPGKGTGGMTDGFPMSWDWEHEQSAWPPWQYTWQTTFITALVTGHHLRRVRPIPHGGEASRIACPHWPSPPANYHTLGRQVRGRQSWHPRAAGTLCQGKYYGRGTLPCHIRVIRPRVHQVAATLSQKKRAVFWSYLGFFNLPAFLPEGSFPAPSQPPPVWRHSVVTVRGSGWRATPHRRPKPSPTGCPASPPCGRGLRVFH